MLGRYSSSCKVKLTVQRAAPPLGQIVNQDDDDDQLLTPPSVAKIITGQVRKKTCWPKSFSSAALSAAKRSYREASLLEHNRDQDSFDYFHHVVIVAGSITRGCAEHAA